MQLHTDSAIKNDLVLKISSDLYSVEEGANASLVVSLVDSTQKNVKHWSAKPNLSIFEDVVLNKWYKHNYTVRVNNYEDGDVLSVYFFNNAKGTIYIDNMKIEGYKVME